MVFNDLFCLSHPQVHTLSIGASRPSDFQEHLKTLAFLAQPQQIPELLNPILERLSAAFMEALGEDWARHWRQGLPSWEQTPGQVNIPTILWLRNLAIAYGMLDYGKMRYNLLGNGGHWFPGQPAKDIDPQLLQECLQNSPYKEQIPYLLQETEGLLGGSEVKRLSTTPAPL
jgi:hypothetical protein